MVLYQHQLCSLTLSATNFRDLKAFPPSLRCHRPGSSTSGTTAAGRPAVMAMGKHLAFLRSCGQNDFFGSGLHPSSPSCRASRSQSSKNWPLGPLEPTGRCQASSEKTIAVCLSHTSSMKKKSQHSMVFVKCPPQKQIETSWNICAAREPAPGWMQAAVSASHWRRILRKNMIGSPQTKPACKKIYIWQKYTPLVKWSPNWLSPLSQERRRRPNCGDLMPMALRGELTKQLASLPGVWCVRNDSKKQPKRINGATN